MPPPKNVSSLTIDAAEQREELMNKGSILLKALRNSAFAKNRAMAGKSNHYFPSDTEIYFSFRKLFTLHYDGLKVKLKVSEKQITALQQVPI